MLGTPPAFVLSQDQTLHVLKRAWKHTNDPEGLSRLRSTHKNAWFPTLRSVRVRNFTLFPRLTHGKWHPCFEAHTSLTPSCQKAPARTQLGHVSRGIVILLTSSEPVKQPALQLFRRSTLWFGQPRLYPPLKSCATPAEPWSKADSLTRLPGANVLDRRPLSAHFRLCMLTA